MGLMTGPEQASPWTKPMVWSPPGFAPCGSGEVGQQMDKLALVLLIFDDQIQSKYFSVSPFITVHV